MKVALVIAAIVGIATPARADAPTAESLYDAGQAAYDAGNFAVAVARWEESYALSKEPALLFNIAQAKRLSGDCPGAIATYRRFVADDPEAEQKPLAEDLARELEGRCGAKSRPVADLPKPDQGNGLNLVSGLNDRKHGGAKPDRKLKIAGVAAGGAGAVTIAVGIGLGIRARSVGDQVTGACRTSCDWSVWKGKDAEGRRDAGIGYALDVVGAVGIAGGVVLYYLGMRKTSIVISPAPREGGAVLTWSGSW